MVLYRKWGIYRSFMNKTKYRKRDINTVLLHAQSGDMQALEELIRRVQKDVFSMFSYLAGKRQDVADLTQEALFKMAKNITSLKDPQKFKQWLNQITANVFYDYLKKHAKYKDLEHNENKLLEIKDKIGCEPGE